MNVSIDIDPSWLRHPDALAEFLRRLRALEKPGPTDEPAAPQTPPAPSRPPADDYDAYEAGGVQRDARPPAPNGNGNGHGTVPCPLKSAGQLWGWAKDHDLVKQLNKLPDAGPLRRKLAALPPARQAVCEI
jgi:hypothetical protein